MQLQMVEFDERVSDSCCKLEAHALLLAGSHGCARELLREAVLCLLCDECDSRSAGNTHAWTAVVLHNVIKNNARHRNLRSVCGCGAQGASPCTNFYCDILSTIELLPPLQAHLVKLRIAGYDNSDIARETRLPVNLVKIILHKAKEGLLVHFAQGSNK